MGDEIRKKAEALIAAIELESRVDSSAVMVGIFTQYKQLKEALKPSKEEVANYLDNELVTHRYSLASALDDDNEYLTHAIEYLREKE